MRLADIDYDLPEDAIAQVPVEPRDGARLLVVDGTRYQHRTVSDLPGLLRPCDLVVANETRVRPARVSARRTSGGAVEILFLRPASGRGEEGWWEALVRPARRLKVGEVVEAEGHPVEIGAPSGDGARLVRAVDGDAGRVMAAAGTVPLPPYVRRSLDDPDRYQTVYARRAGSAAAPTAGLHLTADLLERLHQAGVGWATVDLEVGLDTFRPVREDDPGDHVIHSERWRVPPETVAAVDAARTAGGRVVAVGTTTVRALETAASGGALVAGAGESRLYIRPGHTFRAVDVLLTNFHAPRSTLLVLLTAVMGPRWREAYEVALAAGYRFLSLGDAMLVPVTGASR